LEDTITGTEGDGSKELGVYARAAAATTAEVDRVAQSGLAGQTRVRDGGSSGQRAADDPHGGTSDGLKHESQNMRGEVEHINY